jgi:hypothetical protein
MVLQIGPLHQLNTAVHNTWPASAAAPTLGGAVKPNDLATACRSSLCTLKVSLSWCALYAKMVLRYASRALWCR